MRSSSSERRAVKGGPASAIPPIADMPLRRNIRRFGAHNQTHAPQQIRGDYAARSTRASIKLRSAAKSIGLVRSASAPLSKA